MVLTDHLEQNFSLSFPACIWNVVASPADPVLFLELRDENTRKVRFSALRYRPVQFLWTEKSFDQRWWIGLLGATKNRVLLQEYQEGKPEVKTLVAADSHTGEIRWKKQHFSFQEMAGGVITGWQDGEEKQQVALDPETGTECEKKIAPDVEIPGPVRPFCYYADTAYFETVREYLSMAGIPKVEGFIEYLEYQNKIVVSYHVKAENGLANYLLVLDEDGSVLLSEKLDEHLKGLGTDTFFILSGCLFFVRKKQELLSYFI